jgi:hypothetical protein
MSLIQISRIRMARPADARKQKSIVGITKQHIPIPR